MPVYIAGPTCAVHVIKQAFHKLYYIANIILPNIDNLLIYNYVFVCICGGH